MPWSSARWLLRAASQLAAAAAFCSASAPASWDFFAASAWRLLKSALRSASVGALGLASGLASDAEADDASLSAAGGGGRSDRCLMPFSSSHMYWASACADRTSSAPPPSRRSRLDSTGRGCCLLRSVISFFRFCFAQLLCRPADFAMIRRPCQCACLLLEAFSNLQGRAAQKSV